MLGRRLAIQITIDQRPVDSETRLIELGGYHLALSTVLLSAEHPIELHSSYLGHPASDTHAVHLQIARDHAEMRIASHDPTQLPVTHARERCVLDHLQVLVELATELDHTLQVDLHDHASIR